MKEIITTKFGNARIDNRGYYRIHTKKEGNKGKLLHRLIWEDYYKKSIPNGYVIHHINEDKLDNRIQNLQCVEKSLHTKFHSKGRLKGEKHPNWNKKRTKQTCIKISKATNTTGYYRVSILKDKSCKQGFIWRYMYYGENGKHKIITRVNFDDLEKEAKKRGLPWYKIKGGG